MQVATIVKDPAQVETELGSIVSALLGSGCAGEEMAKARSGKRRRRHDGVAHGTEAIAKGEVYVAGEEPLDAVADQKLQEPAAGRFSEIVVVA